MKILIEGHSYQHSHIEDICGGFERAENGNVKISKVGYFFNPRIGDCVICLPKVIKDYRRETYLGGITAEDMIDAFSSKNRLNDIQREFVQNFSLWSYRTISTYAQLNADSSIVSKSDSSAFSNSKESVSGTLLDVIFAIIEFYNHNKDYFMYVIKNLHSGYDRINWRKTISHKTPIFQYGSPIYVDVINRKKQINFDEELMIIFYSILNYISSNLGIMISVECNYDLIRGTEFKAYMEGLGETRLNAIKYKYFSDKDLKLWNLCYAFFQKTSGIQSSNDISDFLLISSFEIVFESMIDALIGDPDLSDIKSMDDGKIIDHIFRYHSPIDGKDIYYIGDSKYYSIGAEIEDKSIYKQFTYAKNIIQYHFNGKLETSGYRDTLTEGYNFTPNFFISAYIPDELTYENTELSPRAINEKKHRMSHFENRLFDRDTLWLTHFDINLLFVMMLYSQNNSAEQSAFKAEFKSNVRKAFWKVLTTKYDFYKIIPHSGNINDFVKKNFMLLNGKIYSTSDGSLILALEKACKESNNEILNEVSNSAKMLPATLQSIIQCITQ